MKGQYEEMVEAFEQRRVRKNRTRQEARPELRAGRRSQARARARQENFDLLLLSRQWRGARVR